MTQKIQTVPKLRGNRERQKGFKTRPVANSGDKHRTEVGDGSTALVMFGCRRAPEHLRMGARIGTNKRPVVVTTTFILAER